MKTSIFVIILLTICLLATPLYAEETTVWQIGQFNGTYDDLAIARNFGVYSKAFPNDITYRVGTDMPSKNWSYIQPGPVDAWAGSRNHPFNIIFNLNEKPVGRFTLQIALINTHPGSPPRYEIGINGRADSMQLPNGGPDDSLGNPDAGKKYNITLVFPADVFKTGENKITLVSTNGSWLLYDALKLTNDPSATGKQTLITNFQLNPTFRFIKQGKALKQIIEMNAIIAAGASQCEAEYTIGNVTKKLAIQPSLFGLISQELPIDEVKTPIKMTAVLRYGDSVKKAECEIKLQKKWKIYVMPSVHVDVGYTDFQWNVIKRHNDNTTTVLDLMKKYPNFVWNMETAWAENNYLSMMPEDRIAEFIQRAKEGRLGCQVNYGNMLTGIESHEEFIRSLYYAKSVAKKYGFPFEIAISSDVPTDVWTLPTILAGSGIKYFATGINATRGESIQAMFGKSPFYWEGPDGAKVLSWYAPGYGQAQGLGLAESCLAAQKQIESFIGGLNSQGYKYDAAFAFGGFGDNGPIDIRLASVTAEWNKKYEYPKVILCRGPEFFKYIESKYKGNIPTIRGDGGVYWEDGAGSSAHETAITRNAKERLSTAEKLYSMTTVLNGTLYPTEFFDDAWKEALLYDEHTWGAAGSIDAPESEQTVKQWKYKSDFAVRANGKSDALLTNAIGNLANSMKAKDGSILVYNPNSWTQSGLVMTPDGNYIQADNVPSLGYKIYPKEASLISAAGESLNTSNVLENRYYRIEFNPATGAVQSLFDKELKRELVDKSAKYGVNQYVYITGQAQSERDVTAISNVKLSGKKTAQGQVMDITSSAYNTPILMTSVVLYDDVKRIDFNNSIDKTAVYTKEAGYFAFPFAMNKPEFHIDLPDGVVNPATDMLPGACMSWYCAQDYAAVKDEGAAVIWSAIDSPLITLCDINRDTFVSPLPITNGHLYSYAFNNYWFTNYKASQGGHLDFRFSITSTRSFDSAAATRFGQTVRNPMLAVKCGSTKNIKKFSPEQESFMSVKPENVVIQTVKKAESGEGYIIRLRETAGKSVKAAIILPAKRFTSAWTCNLVEDPGNKLKIAGDVVTVDVPANGLATVMVK